MPVSEKTWRDFPELAKEPLKKMLFEEGMSNVEIANRIGCGRASVVAAVKAHGLCGERMRMVRRVIRARRRVS